MRLHVPGETLPLGPGAEFDRIRAISRTLGARAAGLGDDCGFIREGEGYLAFSTDVSVEQVHFRRDWISLTEAGWRATAAALSDLAAVGAVPAGILCALTAPAGSTESELLQVMEGVGAATEWASATVLGGDLSSGPSWSLAVTVVGRTRCPVTRSGAQVGDGVWVTGSLGGARAALESWRRDTQPSGSARTCFAHPEPRIAAGRWLADHGARAMIDISDGLAGDAGHLAAASAVSIEIELESLPVHSDVPPVAERLGLAPSRFAAEGGEDFELLVALPGDFDAASRFARECGVSLTRIGVAREGSEVQLLQQGRRVSLKGFNHFG